MKIANRLSAILFHKVCFAPPFVLLICVINPCLISGYEYIYAYRYRYRCRYQFELEPTCYGVTS
jgi:hypothetical protein